MIELYREWRSAPIRPEGLRRTPLEMVRGTVRWEAGQLISSNGAIARLTPGMGTPDPNGLFPSLLLGLLGRIYGDRQPQVNIPVFFLLLKIFKIIQGFIS